MKLLPVLLLLPVLTACSKSGKSEPEQGPLPAPTSAQADESETTDEEADGPESVATLPAPGETAAIDEPVQKRDRWVYKNPGNDLPDGSVLSTPVIPLPDPAMDKPAPEGTPVSTNP